MPWRRTTLLATLTLLAVALTAPSASADRIVARSVGSATIMRGANDWLVWSQFVAEARTVLRARHGGRTMTLRRVAPRTGLFDLDVGPTQDGGTAAVFSRRGRLRLVPLRPRARERAIDVALPPGATARWPSIWRGRLAYVVRFAAGAKQPDRIMEGPLGGPFRRLPGGPRKASDGGLSRPRTEPPHAAHLDLVGRRLLYAWHRGTGGEVELYTDRGAAGEPLLEVGFGDLGAEGNDVVSSPFLQRSRARWINDDTNELSGGSWMCSCLTTFDFATRKPRRFQFLGPPLAAAATSTHLYVEDGDGRIVQLGRGTWPVDGPPPAPATAAR